MIGTRSVQPGVVGALRNLRWLRCSGTGEWACVPLQTGSRKDTGAVASLFASAEGGAGKVASIPESGQHETYPLSDLHVGPECRVSTRQHSMRQHLVAGLGVLRAFIRRSAVGFAPPVVWALDDDGAEWTQQLPAIGVGHGVHSVSFRRVS